MSPTNNVDCVAAADECRSAAATLAGGEWCAGDTRALDGDSARTGDSARCGGGGVLDDVTLRSRLGERGMAAAEGDVRAVVVGDDDVTESDVGGELRADGGLLDDEMLSAGVVLVDSNCGPTSQRQPIALLSTHRR
jgi:hypothetical protein